MFVFSYIKKNEYCRCFNFLDNKKLIISELLFCFRFNIKIRIAFFVCFFSCFALSAQFEMNYAPIEIEGEIPPRFYHSLKGKTKIDIVLEDEGMGRRKRKEFSTTTSFTLREIFLSGSIYYNDPCTPYVREVTENLLETLQSGKNVSVFVGRFVSPNAAIWQDGTLIVNVGLLAKLENEAQLAFVLAHEIAHYENKHPFLQYARKQKPGNIQKRALDNLKASLAYTQQNECSADTFALELLERAGYDSREGARAVELLMKDKRAEETVYVTQLLGVKQTDMCDDLKAQTHMGVGHDVAEHFAPVMLAERKAKIDAVKTTTGELWRVSERDFERVKGIAQFEVVENNFREADYISTLCKAAKLKNTYPENQYLQEKIVESLFQLYHYKKRGEEGGLLKMNQGNYSTNDLSHLCCYIKSADIETLQKLTATYLKEQYERYGTVSETIAITAAKYTALAAGKAAAKAHFRHYMKYFPKGKHYLYAEQRQTIDSSR